MKTIAILISTLGVLTLLGASGCGEPGEMGEDGEMGATGPAGSEGAAGEAGPVGATGPRGPKGENPDAGTCILDIDAESPAQAASIHLEGTLTATGGFYFAGGNGDVNGDGAVSGADVTVARNLLRSGELAPAEYQAIDVNGDGHATELDLDWIRAMSLGMSLEEARQKSRYEAEMLEHSRTHGGDGDVNEDGAVNVIDISTTIAYLNGSSELTLLQRARADLNGDGRVDRADVEQIMEKSFNRYNFDDARYANDRAFFTTRDGYFGIGKHSSGPPAASECDGSLRTGATALDTTNMRLYVCSGNAWRYLTLTQ